jgi:hypothetical protein
VPHLNICLCCAVAAALVSAGCAVIRLLLALVLLAELMRLTLNLRHRNSTATQLHDACWLQCCTAVHLKIIPTLTLAQVLVAAMWCLPAQCAWRASSPAQCRCVLAPVGHAIQHKFMQIAKRQ